MEDHDVIIHAVLFSPDMPQFECMNWLLMNNLHAQQFYQRRDGGLAAIQMSRMVLHNYGYEHDQTILASTHVKLIIFRKRKTNNNFFG